MGWPHYPLREGAKRPGGALIYNLSVGYLPTDNPVVSRGAAARSACGRHKAGVTLARCPHELLRAAARAGRQAGVSPPCFSTRARGACGGSARPLKRVVLLAATCLPANACIPGRRPAGGEAVPLIGADG